MMSVVSLDYNLFYIGINVELVAGVKKTIENSDLHTSKPLLIVILLIILYLGTIFNSYFQPSLRITLFSTLSLKSSNISQSNVSLFLNKRIQNFSNSP